MKKGSLQRHMEQVHNRQPDQYMCREVKTSAIFNVDIEKGKYNNCPIPGCTGGSKDKFGMYRHFCYRHSEATLIIKDDGLLPKCSLCSMHAKFMTRHKSSTTCKRARVRRNNESMQDKQFEAGKVIFLVYGKEIERVREFRYLGRIFTEDDDDTKCIKSQLKRARQKWISI